MHITISICYKSGLPAPENLLLSIYQHTTACRYGEKFVPLESEATGGVLNWGIT